MKELGELEAKIIEYSNYYYNGTPIVSDSMFDSLLDRLKKESPNHYLLTKIGHGYKTSKAKSKHKFGTVGSLLKTKKLADVFKKLEGEIIITPKLDGGSVTVEYNEGQLVQALSRGNGQLGIDITHHVAKIVPLTIPTRENICFRGEAVLRKDIFEEKYSKDYANPRNMVTGTLNKKTQTDIVKDFDIVFYSIMSESFYSKIDMLTKIKKNGLKTVKHEKLQNLGNEEIITSENVISMLKKFIDIEYMTDGLVCNQNVVDHHCEKALALKFDAESSEMDVERVEWSTGSTGRVSPVIILREPVQLSGTKVQRVTGNNYKNIVELGIGSGATLEVIKSNEIIPMVKSVIERAPITTAPYTCPICNTKLSIRGVDLVCSNTNCMARQFSSIKKVLEIASIPEGLSDTTIMKWIEFNKIKTLIDTTNDKICLNPLNSLCREFKEHYGHLLFNMEKNLFKKLKTGFTVEEFWYFINLPTLGKRMAEKLAKYDVYNIDSEQMNVPINIKQAIIDNSSHIQECLKAFKPKVGNKEIIEIKYTVAITGSLSKPRAELIKELIKQGIQVGSVSKSTKYLICNDPSSSSKTQKAEKLGIKIINEEEFYKILGELK